tara:strand:+ start:4808 stop:5227 length:420 start_codon:yes stop_codon:yes gene_type:complete
MGLDMYLEGERYHSKYNKNGEVKRPRCGDYPVKQSILDMGYWRKHPDLHGYIVNTYADGVDECQEILLNSEALEDIACAIEDNRLAHGTSGFFFGNSDDYNNSEDRKENAEIFRKAKDWLDSFQDTERWNVSVKYQASW